MKIKLSEIAEIPLTDIDGDDRLTDFSMDGCPEKLMDSIKVIGIRHPISVCPGGKENHYAIVSGHKRFQAAFRSGLTCVPTFIIPEIEDASRLVINLNENFGQRHYSDIEKGCVLNKFKDAGFSDETIIEQYIPLLELECSRKIFQDLSSVKILSSGLKKLLHRARVPVKIFSALYKWDDLTASENLFSALKPGVNKWRELLDLIDEVAARENTTHGDILSCDDIQKILETSELNAHQKYDRIYRYLYSLRYPVLSDMKKQVARALDEMDLDDKTRLKFQETFESDELKLELKFRNEKDLSLQVEKIFKALQTGSVEKLIKIFTL
jgi:hypothetical protein